MSEAASMNRDGSARLVPQTRGLKTHNHLIGDRAALEAAFDRDGYWFFRDVLDKGAVGRLRQVYINELEKLGVIDPVGDAPTDQAVLYNGTTLADIATHSDRMDQSGAWEAFVAERPIHDFFSKLLNDEPVWMPVVSYRATPPAEDGVRRLAGIHQDGPFTPGIPFRICWVPVTEVDAESGGLVFAGSHTAHVNRHPFEANGSLSFIPLADLPDDCWHQTQCGPGDLLIMHPWTPHSGLTNLSDKFRLSLDIRVMGAHDKLPIVGEVVSIAVDRIEMRDSSGVTSLRINPETYVRNGGVKYGGKKLTGETILEAYPPGSSAVVAHDGTGSAIVVRPVEGSRQENASLVRPGR